jgi:hypothetical protein
MFIVLNLETSEPVKDCEGDPATWESGKEAANYADWLSSFAGKHQVRPLKTDDSWKAREQARFDSGEYIPLRWHGDEKWNLPEIKAIHELHFPHIAKGDPSKIAYTKSEAKGAADRQTRIPVREYLETYFDRFFSPDEISDLCLRHLGSSDATIRFAWTPDEIENAYLECDDEKSCMGHDESHYDSHCHPVRVYGAGDLAVAYLQRDLGDDEDDEAQRIYARVLVWPEKKLYGRFYGSNPGPLRFLLKQEGYSDCWRERSGDGFQGARLLAIETERGYVMPYIDGLNRVSLTYREGKDCFVISRDGNFAATTQDGVLETDAGPTCDHCGDSFGADGEQTVYTRVNMGRSETWCPYCAETHAFYCEGYNEYFADNVESYSMETGETWSEGYFEQNGWTCEHSGGHYPHDEDDESRVRVNVASSAESSRFEFWHIDMAQEFAVNTSEDPENPTWVSKEALHANQLSLSLESAE